MVYADVVRRRIIWRATRLRNAVCTASAAQWRCVIIWSSNPVLSNGSNLKSYSSAIISPLSSAEGQSVGKLATELRQTSVKLDMVHERQGIGAKWRAPFRHASDMATSWLRGHLSRVRPGFFVCTPYPPNAHTNTPTILNPISPHVLLADCSAPNDVIFTKLPDWPNDAQY